MTIKAIETRYAGCRFRSRLEARWAVFFDALGIKWEYEPEGIEVSWRLSLDEGTFNYLPDFWLPTHQVWAEVKGHLDKAAHVRLLNAAAHLSSNGAGGCHDSGGHDLVVLGPIPRPQAGQRQIQPIRLHMHKGDLQAYPWPDCRGHGWDCSDGTAHGGGTSHGEGVARDVGGWGIFDCGMTEPTVRQLLLQGHPHNARPGYVAALTAARSARFEHGESG